VTDTESHETVVQLIGAWALDACSPEEAELVELHLSTCPACAREARDLREAAAALGGAYLRPPAGSLARLRAAAAGRRPAATGTPAYAAPFWDEYVAQVEAVPANVRHLHVHRGHCVWVEPDEERFLTKELLESTCMIGTADNIAARLRALGDAGLTEVMLLPSLATKEKVLRDVAALVMPLLPD